MITRALIASTIMLMISSATVLAQREFDWGQDIRWTVSLEKGRKGKGHASREVVVKVDLRKSPFRKVERVVAKVALFGANGSKIGEEEFSLGDRLEPGKLHRKTFATTRTNVTTVKGIELRAIIDGETYVNKPIKPDGRKIARKRGGAHRNHSCAIHSQHEPFPSTTVSERVRDHPPSSEVNVRERLAHQPLLLHLMNRMRTCSRARARRTADVAEGLV